MQAAHRAVHTVGSLGTLQAACHGQSLAERGLQALILHPMQWEDSRTVKAANHQQQHSLPVTSTCTALSAL